MITGAASPLRGVLLRTECHRRDRREYSCISPDAQATHYIPVAPTPRTIIARVPGPVPISALSLAHARATVLRAALTAFDAHPNPLAVA
jgi:hypothetical protein